MFTCLSIAIIVKNVYVVHKATRPFCRGTSIVGHFMHNKCK